MLPAAQRKPGEQGKYREIVYDVCFSAKLNNIANIKQRIEKINK